MLFSISKQTLPRLPGQLISMTEIISGIVTPKYKTKSNSFARQKVSVKFLVFPSVINRRKFSLPKGYQHYGMEVKWTGRTNHQAEMINPTCKSNTENLKSETGKTLQGNRRYTKRNCRNTRRNMQKHQGCFITWGNTMIIMGN